jgi:hypothetical protein
MAIERAGWFEKAVAKFLLEDSKKSGRNNGLLRGSSLGLKCPRRLGYMVLGYEEEPTTAHDQYVLAFGNAFHDMVQGWMSRMGLVNATPFIHEGTLSLLWKGDAEQHILDAKDGVIGHYDGFTRPITKNEDTYVLAEKEGDRYLLEFKTISNKNKIVVIYYEVIDGIEYTVKYVLPQGRTTYDDLPRLEGSPPKKLSSKGNEKYAATVGVLRKNNTLPRRFILDIINKPGKFTELTKPKEEHIDQATYYAHKLNADKILIVYLAKDFDRDLYQEDSIWNIPIKAFESDIDIEVVSSLKRKTSSFWATLEEQQSKTDNPEAWLPPRPFSPDEHFSECKWCPYSYVCYPNHISHIEKTTRRFEEQALANLPVAKGVAFERHKIWGRKEALKGNIIDTSDASNVDNGE